MLLWYLRKLTYCSFSSYEVKFVISFAAGFFYVVNEDCRCAEDSNQHVHTPQVYAAIHHERREKYDIATTISVNSA